MISSRIITFIVALIPYAVSFRQVSLSKRGPVWSSPSHEHKQLRDGIPSISSPLQRTTSLNAFLLDGDTTTSIISSCSEIFESQPYLAAFLTCSLQSGAADFLAQRMSIESATEVQELVKQDQDHPTFFSNQNINLKQTLAFLSYGGLYSGLCQQYLYSSWYPNLFANFIGTWQGTFLQIGFDCCILGPFVCLPVCYFLKSLCESETVFSANADILSSLTNTAQNSMNKYWVDVVDQKLLLKYWALWIPVQSMNFSIIPENYQVAFCALVSFAWIFMLSLLSSKTSQKDGAQPKNLATESQTMSFITKQRSASPALIPDQYVPARQELVLM